VLLQSIVLAVAIERCLRPVPVPGKICRINFGRAREASDVACQRIVDRGMGK